MVQNYPFIFILNSISYSYYVLLSSNSNIKNEKKNGLFPSLVKSGQNWQQLYVLRPPGYAWFLVKMAAEDKS